MPEAGVLTAQLHVAATAILPPDQAVTATARTVQRAGSLVQVPTIPVATVRAPLKVMVPTVAARATTTVPAPVPVAIRIPPLRREQLRHQLEALQAVTAHQGPAHPVLQTRPEQQQLLPLLLDRRTLRLRPIQPIHRAARLQVLPIHLPPAPAPALVPIPAVHEAVVAEVTVVAAVTVALLVEDAGNN